MNKVNEIEKLRKEAQVSIVLSGISVVVMVPILIFFMNIFLVFVAIGAVIAVSMNSSKKIAKFRYAFKESYIKLEFEKAFDTKAEFRWSGYDFETIEDSYVVPFGNQYESDDYVKLKYKGVMIERGDVCTKNITHTGKTTIVTQLFSGPYMIFSFPKKISNFMVIREKEFLNGGKPGGMFSNCPKTEKIQLESVEFNDRFHVYAQDEHDAFYLLTPTFMEKLMDLENRYQGKCYFGFMNDQFHVAIDSGKNSFEANLFKTIDDNVIYDHIRDIEEIKEMVEILNLKVGE